MRKTFSVSARAYAWIEAGARSMGVPVSHLVDQATAELKPEHAAECFERDRRATARWA